MITTTIRIESWRRSGRRSMQQNRRHAMANQSLTNIKTMKR